MKTEPSAYHGFRFPAEIINQAVWLHHCFSLSLREVELILAAQGIVVSYETIREWSLRFGRAYANSLKRRRATGAILTASAATQWRGYILTAGTALFMLTLKRSPLIPLAISAALGFLGLVQPEPGCGSRLRAPPNGVCRDTPQCREHLAR